MAGEFAGKARFVKIDLTDDDSAVADQYEITALPSTVIVKNGKESGRVLGIDANDVRAEVEKAM